MGQQAYDGLSDDARAMLDAARGRGLSQSAEEAWNATGEAAVIAARATGDNTFVDLTPEEAQAFADAVSGVTAAYVAAVGGEAALAAMQK